MLVGREVPFRDPVTDDFLGYTPVQTTVGDFLRVGIPALGARGSGLIAFNRAAQANLDSINLTFQREAACAPSDVIEVPVIYFPYEGDPSLSDALTGGMANMLVLGTHCIAAKAFGPIISGGVDVFEQYLHDRLSGVGATVDFVDDWYPYHVQLGEVHCGTNTRRAPRSAKWWHFTP
jgi:protein-arginine deiminase